MSSKTKWIIGAAAAAVVVAAAVLLGIFAVPKEAAPQTADELMAAAQNGDAQAQNDVGALFEEGDANTGIEPRAV